MNTYFITVRWEGTPAHPPLIDAVLGLAGDWVRFTADSWILKSIQSTHEVQELLRKHLTATDSFLVLSINPPLSGGLAPMWLWNWMGNTNAVQFPPALPGPPR